MKPYLLAFMVIFMLACGAPAAVSGREYQASVPVATSENVVTMQVMAESLNVRTAPSWRAPALYKGLSLDDVVTVYLDCKVVIEGDTQWLAINESCSRWVSGNYLTMTEAK